MQGEHRLQPLRYCEVYFWNHRSAGCLGVLSLQIRAQLSAGCSAIGVPSQKCSSMPAGSFRETAVDLMDGPGSDTRLHIPALRLRCFQRGAKKPELSSSRSSQSIERSAPASLREGRWQNSQKPFFGVMIIEYFLLHFDMSSISFWAGRDVSEL